MAAAVVFASQQRLYTDLRCSVTYSFQNPKKGAPGVPHLLEFRGRIERGVSEQAGSAARNSNSGTYPTPWGPTAECLLFTRNRTNSAAVSDGEFVPKH